MASGQCIYFMLIKKIAHFFISKGTKQSIILSLKGVHMKNMFALVFALSFTSMLQAEEYCSRANGVQTCSKTISYSVDSNVDANNCEFFIEGFAEGSWTHSGSSSRWVEAKLRVDKKSLENHQDGEVLAAGIYSAGTFFTGTAQGNLYTVGITFEQSPRANEARPVKDFAFFVDVKRSNGNVDRLWVKNGNRDFTMNSVFGNFPVYEQSLGSGTMFWVQGASPIFNQAKACRR